MEELELKLTQQNILTAEQLNSAKADSSQCGKSIWASLVKLGYMSEEDIAIFFSQESGINYVRISDYEINYEVIRLLEEGFCRENLVIPLFKIKDTLFVACTNPLDTILIDSLTKLSGCSVELLIATRLSIVQALDLYLGPEEKSFNIVKLMYKQGPLQGLIPWRESERLNLSIPVSIRVEDKSISLNCSSPLEGYSRNISQSGTAIGLQVFLFLPKGVNVSLEFYPNEASGGSPAVIKAKGEIVYSRMEKGQRYLLGILFTEIDELARSQLFKLAASS